MQIHLKRTPSKLDQLAQGMLATSKDCKASDWINDPVRCLSYEESAFSAASSLSERC